MLTWLAQVWPVLVIALGAAWLLHGRPGVFEFDADEGLYFMRAHLARDGFRLYGDIWMDQPPLIVWALVGAFRVVGETVEAGRSVAVIVAALGLVAVGALAAQAAGRLAGAVATLALALAPLFNWFGRAVMPDMHANSLAALALLVAFRASQGGLAWAALSGLLYGASLMVKLVTLPVAPVILAALLWGQPGARLDLKRVAAWGVGALIPVVLALAPVDLAQAGGLILGTVAQARDAKPWDLADNWEVIQGVLADGHLGLLTLGLVGLAACLARPNCVKWITVLWAGLTSASILVHSPLYDHHLALVLFPLAALAGIGIAQATRGWGWRVALVAALAVYVWAFPTAWELTTRTAGNREGDNWRMLDDLRAMTTPGDWVITDNVMLAFRAGVRVPPFVSTPGAKRTSTGQLPDEVWVRETATWQPRAVLFMRTAGQSARAAYLAWVDHTYRLTKQYGETRRLWTPEEGGPVITLSRQAVTPGVSFEGFSLAEPTLRRGEPARVGLFWQSEQPLVDGFDLRVGLVGPDGRTVARDDGPLRNGSAEKWRYARGDWTLETRALTPPADAPPGEYSLEVTLIRKTDGQTVGAPIRLARALRLP